MDFSSHSSIPGALSAAIAPESNGSGLLLEQPNHPGGQSGLGNSLDLALNQSYDALMQFHQQDSFETSMTLAFGSTYDLVAANHYFETLADRGVEGLIAVESLQGEQLLGANGVYTQAKDRVYLSEAFVDGASTDALTGVLLEEFGHGLDAQINDDDAAGDEGDIFARLVLGKSISPQQLQQLQAEDDSSTLEINGETLAVEMNTAFNNQLYQVSRGEDNHIYSRSSQDGLTWGNWSKSSNTQTLSTPAMATFKGKLFQSMRGTDNGIYTRHSEDGTQWSPWRKDQGGSLDAPSLEVFNGRLYQTVRGGDNGIYTRSSSDGFSWDAWTNHGGATLDAPSQSSFNGKLYQSVRGGDNGIYTRSSSNGRQWTGWKSIDGGTLNAPEIAEFQGQLFQAVRGGDNAIHIRTSQDGEQWTAWQHTGGAIASAVQMTVFDNQLHQFATGIDGENYSRVSTDGTSWSPFAVVDDAAINGTTTNGKTAQSFTSVAKENGSNNLKDENLKNKNINAASNTSDLKKYWFYYSFNPDSKASSDSYLGSVIAPKGTYQIAPSLPGGGHDPAYAFNPKPQANQANSDGKYFIYREEEYSDDLVSDLGQVFVLAYTNREGKTAKTITPNQYAQGAKPSGFNFLGSETDYISPTQHGTAKFGQDYFEADIQNPDIDIQAYRPQGVFAPNQLNAINTAISNWEQLIVSDKDSSGILKIAFTHSFQRIHGSNWNGVWGEAYIDQLTGERMERNSALVDIGGDYDNRINYNTVKLGRLSSSELIRLTMHEIGHTLGLDEAQEDSSLGLDSVMDKRGLDAHITEGMFQRLEALGYGVDRTAVSRLKWF